MPFAQQLKSAARIDAAARSSDVMPGPMRGKLVEILLDLLRIPVPPHVHAGVAGPVVAAEREFTAVKNTRMTFPENRNANCGHSRQQHHLSHVSVPVIILQSLQPPIPTNAPRTDATPLVRESSRSIFCGPSVSQIRIFSLPSR